MCGRSRWHVARQLYAAARDKVMRLRSLVARREAGAASLHVAEWQAEQARRRIDELETPHPPDPPRQRYGRGLPQPWPAEPPAGDDAA